MAQDDALDFTHDPLRIDGRKLALPEPKWSGYTPSTDADMLDLRNPQTDGFDDAAFIDRLSRATPDDPWPVESEFPVQGDPRGPLTIPGQYLGPQHEDPALTEQRVRDSLGRKADGIDGDWRAMLERMSADERDELTSLEEDLAERRASADALLDKLIALMGPIYVPTGTTFVEGTKASLRATCEKALESTEFIGFYVKPGYAGRKVGAYVLMRIDPVTDTALPVMTFDEPRAATITPDRHREVVEKLGMGLIAAMRPSLHDDFKVSFDWRGDLNDPSELGVHLVDDSGLLTVADGHRRIAPWLS